MQKTKTAMCPTFDLFKNNLKKKIKKLQKTKFGKNEKKTDLLCGSFLFFKLDKHC